LRLSLFILVVDIHEFGVDHRVFLGAAARLRAVASRIEAGAVAAADAARLRQEAERLARCLPADLPVYPLRGDGPR
jgi:hypothetical protein